ncbi:MAG: hypothetical protein WD009_00995 [Phycisphaeraceae bacterium]
MQQRADFWEHHLLNLPRPEDRRPGALRALVASCAAVIKAGEGRDITILAGDVSSSARASAYKADIGAIIENINSAIRAGDTTALADYGALADLVLGHLAAGEPLKRAEFSLVRNNIFMRLCCPSCRASFQPGEWVVSVDGTRNGAICHSCAENHAPDLVAFVRAAWASPVGPMEGPPF